MMERITRLVFSDKCSDVISNLPADIINVILMGLPLRDAVRTSVLSRKWRYNWAKLPKLMLDHTLWNETTQDLSTPRTKFAMILCQLLSLHQGPVTKCKICIPGLKGCPEIDNLIFFLSRNGVEHLVLEFSNSEKYKLPASVFTCSQMRILVLHYCLVNPPPTFESFSRLLCLKLCNVTISDESLANLISCCPLLNHLALENLDPLNYIEVNAPRLRIFYFEGVTNFVCFKNTALLVEVWLYAFDHESSERRGKYNLVNFFGSLPAVKILILDYYIIKTLITGLDKIPVRLPMHLCLRKLSVVCISLSVLDEVCSLLCLIRSSPYLEEIEIEVFNVKGDELPALKCLEVEYNSSIELNQLTKVVLQDISGKKSEMELIKLLLAKSPMLKTMIIEPWIKPESPQTLVEIGKQVTIFQKASPQAQVIFRDRIVDASLIS